MTLIENNSPKIINRFHTEQDTSINSFYKQNQTHTRTRTGLEPQQKGQQSILKIQSNPNFNKVLSITQKQILSHELISYVVDKSKKNTVQHNVNRIPIQTRLYSLPKDADRGQFDFDTIPPTNEYFASTASKKLKQINQRLNNRKSLAERYKQKLASSRECTTSSYRSKQKGNSRAMSADHNKRVSVSGLVSYNFNSINARRSLGYIPDEPEQVQLAKKVTQSKKITCSGLDRQQKIRRRNPTTNNMQKIEMQNAIVCDFHTATDKYLKIIKQQRERDKVIYGERMQKLDCIKQYMQKQKSTYENSSFIVQTVLSSVDQEGKQIVKKQKQKSTIDDEQMLEKRRKVMQKKKVILRHLYFTQ